MLVCFDRRAAYTVKLMRQTNTHTHTLTHTQTKYTQTYALTFTFQVANVYMIAHVTDDIGQAVVTGALEAAGLLGPLPTQVWI